MRSKLAIAFGGVVFIGMIAPVFAQPATQPTQTGPTYNTMPEASTNSANPGGQPASGLGSGPASSRLQPGDSSTAQPSANAPTNIGPNAEDRPGAAAPRTRGQ
jgi:hypothetical protein